MIRPWPYIFAWIQLGQGKQEVLPVWNNKCQWCVPPPLPGVIVPRIVDGGKIDGENGLTGILTETGQKNLRRAHPVASLRKGGWSALGVHGDAQLGQRGGWTGQLFPQLPIHTQTNHYHFQWLIFKNTTDKPHQCITSSPDYTSILIWTSWDSSFFVCMCLYVHTHTCIHLDVLATKS